MITVEQALKKSNKTRNLLEGDEKKKSNKTILLIGFGLLGAYVGYRMLRGNNENISAQDT